MTPQDYGRLLSHTTRADIMRIMDGDAWSPSMLAVELRVSLSLMSYHVKTLLRMGALKTAGTRPRRGAIEHLYRADPRVQAHLILLLEIIDPGDLSQAAA